MHLLASSYAPTKRIQADTQASGHPRQKMLLIFHILRENSPEQKTASSWRDKAEFKAIITVRDDGKAPWRDALCPQTQFSTLIKSHMD